MTAELNSILEAAFMQPAPQDGSAQADLKALKAQLDVICAHLGIDSERPK